MSIDRKLSKHEIKRIRTLVISLCANFGYENRLCYPSGKECCMFSIKHQNECCAYFLKAVLPTEPVLYEALAVEFNAADLCQKECKACGSMFFAAKNQAYCTPECRAKGDREMNRNRVARHRRKQKTA